MLENPTDLLSLYFSTKCVEIWVPQVVMYMTRRRRKPAVKVTVMYSTITSWITDQVVYTNWESCWRSQNSIWNEFTMVHLLYYYIAGMRDQLLLHSYWNLKKILYMLEVQKILLVRERAIILHSSFFTSFHDNHETWNFSAKG